MKKKIIPKFQSEDAERDFWNKNDTFGFIDWSKAKEVRLPKLKPSTTQISLRMPDSLLNQIKTIANKNDVPYQSLIKMFLANQVQNFEGNQSGK